MSLRSLTTILAVVAILTICVPAEAGLFHGTFSKEAADRIFTRGFAKNRMSNTARLGKGVYLSEDMKTVLRERPNAKAIIAFKRGKGFNKRILDTRRMSIKRLKAVSGLKDMRGTVKNGVIGPKAGHGIGRYASKKGYVIKFNSARLKGSTNYMIPKPMYRPYGRLIVKPKVMNIK